MLKFMDALWRYGARVSTRPSQGRNPGSNPGIAARFCFSASEFLKENQKQKQVPLLRIGMTTWWSFVLSRATLRSKNQQQIPLLRIGMTTSLALWR
jgi:hypothetical protein